MMSPNIHSTKILTLLIELLYSSMRGFGATIRKGVCRCTLKGYARSPYRQRGCPVVEKAYWLRSLSSLESASMPASCFLPSVESNWERKKNVSWS